jgi:plastocyanin
VRTDPPRPDVSIGIAGQQEDGSTMAERRFRTRVAGSLAGAALIAALAGGTAGTALAADHAVSIAGFAFSPQSITVTVGDTVTWTNSDSASHTATADDNSFDTGSIANGGSKSVTFSTTGTFPYHCTIHSSMTGTVVVEAAAGGGATPAPTTPATDTVASPVAGSPNQFGAFLAVLAAAWLLGLAVVGRRLTGRP